MTRENKLALVVGFALMLLVGILVSDHFSTAQAQEAATLARVSDPLGAPTGPADLIALDGEDLRPAPATAETRAVDPLVSGETLAIEMGRRSPHTPVNSPDPVRRHHVNPKESLSSICTTYYGDPSLATALARYNELDDPNRLPEGMALRYPGADRLIRRGDAPPPAPVAVVADAAPAPVTPNPEATYTVVENDSLSRIAQKLLGSGHRWADIFDANRDQLDSPDEIRPGMTLRVPGTTG